jgi:GTP-binding protein LepA
MIQLQPLEGFSVPQPMLYASVYPLNSDEFENLTHCVDRLALNDSALTIQRESSTSLGTEQHLFDRMYTSLCMHTFKQTRVHGCTTTDLQLRTGSGLRCGFLGFLHCEIFSQRLRDEFNMDVMLTTPTVPYIVEYADGTQAHITNLANWPEVAPR